MQMNLRCKYVLVQGMSFMNHYLERVPVRVSLQGFLTHFLEFFILFYCNHKQDALVVVCVDTSGGGETH